jgi:hypothetical protein
MELALIGFFVRESMGMYRKISGKLIRIRHIGKKADERISLLPDDQGMPFCVSLL